MTEIEPAAAVPRPVLIAHAYRPDLSPYWTYIGRLKTDESKRAMQRCLDRIAFMLMPPDGEAFTWPGKRKVPPCYGEHVPWHMLGYGHATAISAALTQLVEKSEISPNHAAKHRAALRGVIREAWRHGYITADSRDRINDIPAIDAERLPAGRDIPLSEFTAMLRACDDDTPLGTRDAAMIAALQSTGARRAEIAAMLIELYDRTARSIKIIGKRNRQRIVYFHPEAVVRIDRWLTMVGERRGPVFRPVDQWNHIAPRHLSPRSVGRIVDARRKKAALPPLTTHDWRRTFIGDILDASGDLAHAQALAGHQSPVTTAQYDRRPDEERRAIVDRLTTDSLRELQEKRNVQAAVTAKPDEGK